MPVILFFGDSLTAGYGLQNVSSESFPSLIHAKINAESLSYEVVNAGISGDTSSGGLQRLDYWLSRPIDVFVLELGINDIMRGVQPATTLKNLDLIIERVKTKYPQCKLALMGMDVPVFIPAQWATEFRSIFKKLADKHQMAFVPFFLKDVLGVQQLNFNDGLHPNAQGYKIIANNVWPVLRPLLLDKA